MNTAIAVDQTTALWTPDPSADLEGLRNTLCSFLDIASTAFGRATHYNTREETEKAERTAHEFMLAEDRDLYVAFLTLPGVTDRSQQLGVRNLLANSRGSDGFLTPEIERAVVASLMRRLPPQRVLKMFETFVRDRKAGVAGVNNNRTRKLILRTLLRNKSFPFWCVKYRSKIGAALTHAWGQKHSSILRSILSKAPSARNAKEHKILADTVERWVPGLLCGDPDQDVEDRRTLHESVGFALGSERGQWTVLHFRRFEAAKRKLEDGRGLPLEVLEGIRSQYHATTPKERVIELCAPTMSKGQRMNTQRSAERAGVKVEMDPTDYDAVKLYVYAYERGMTPEIEAALDAKAAKAAEGYPMSHGKVAIIMDTSRSMEGSGDQKMRPIACACATRDMLLHVSERSATIHTTSGVKDRLAKPSGGTGLGRLLIDAVKDLPDAVYVISDGYENEPAGRFAEVVREMHKIGIKVPIYHFNPVAAAESTGVRELAPNKVPTMPVQRPDGVGVSILRGLIDQDPVHGVNALLGIAKVRELM